MGYFFIFLTVALTTYGQLVLKWQVNQAGALPTGVTDQIGFIARLLLNPWVLSGLAAAFGASLFWMAAMSKFDLSKAYPFMASSFVVVGLLASWLFQESLGTHKITGMALVVLGLVVMTRA